MAGGWHLIGRVVDNIRSVYNGELTDAEFEQLTKDGLPEGWYAFHLEANENAENSERVRTLRDMARIVVPNGCDYFSERPEYGERVWNGGAVQYSTPMAKVETSIAQAHLFDAVCKFLDGIKPEGLIPTNFHSYFEPLLEQVRANFPVKDGYMVLRWIKQQPGSVHVCAFDNPKKYRVREAMPGTDGYGWFVEVLGTDGLWYNFYGNRPQANQERVSNITTRLEKDGYTQVTI
jgi:hypothetical protein